MSWYSKVSHERKQHTLIIIVCFSIVSHLFPVKIAVVLNFTKGFFTNHNGFAPVFVNLCFNIHHYFINSGTATKNLVTMAT